MRWSYSLEGRANPSSFGKNKIVCTLTTFYQFVQFYGQPVFPSYCKYLQWDLHIKVDGKMCKIFTRI